MSYSADDAAAWLPLFLRALISKTVNLLSDATATTQRIQKRLAPGLKAVAPTKTVQGPLLQPPCRRRAKVF
jgi:hypothetical protein